MLCGWRWGCPANDRFSFKVETSNWHSIAIVKLSHTFDWTISSDILNIKSPCDSSVCNWLPCWLEDPMAQCPIWYILRSNVFVVNPRHRRGSSRSNPCTNSQGSPGLSILPAYPYCHPNSNWWCPQCGVNKVLMWCPSLSGATLLTPIQLIKENPAGVSTTESWSSTLVA